MSWKWLERTQGLAAALRSMDSSGDGVGVAVARVCSVAADDLPAGSTLCLGRVALTVSLQALSV